MKMVSELMIKNTLPRLQQIEFLVKIKIEKIHSPIQNLDLIPNISSSNE